MGMGSSMAQQAAAGLRAAPLASSTHSAGSIASPVAVIAPPFLSRPQGSSRMAERVQSPRPGRYGLSAVGQLFSKDTQAIFYNWCVAAGC